jgi:hypothetical protein
MAGQEHSAGQERIGTVEALTGQAFVDRGGQLAPLSRGDGLSQGDTVLTRAGAHIEIRFVDDTVLSEGADSRLVLDQYVYDPSQGGNLAFRMAEGAFKVVTGRIADSHPENFVLKSPLATIGIRGTTVVSEIRNGVEKHGAEEIHSGKALTIQNLFGEVRTVTQSGALVDFRPDGSMGQVRPFTIQEIQTFQSATPITVPTFSPPPPPAGQGNPPSGGQQGQNQQGQGQGGQGQPGQDSQPQSQSQPGQGADGGLSGSAQVGLLVGGLLGQGGLFGQGGDGQPDTGGLNGNGLGLGGTGGAGTGGNTPAPGGSGLNPGGPGLFGFLNIPGTGNSPPSNTLPPDLLNQNTQPQSTGGSAQATSSGGSGSDTPANLITAATVTVTGSDPVSLTLSSSSHTIVGDAASNVITLDSPSNLVVAVYGHEGTDTLTLVPTSSNDLVLGADVEDQATSYVVHMPSGSASQHVSSYATGTVTLDTDDHTGSIYFVQQDNSGSGHQLFLDFENGDSTVWASSVSAEGNDVISLSGSHTNLVVQGEGFNYVYGSTSGFDNVAFSGVANHTVGLYDIDGLALSSPGGLHGLTLVERFNGQTDFLVAVNSDGVISIDSSKDAQAGDHPVHGQFALAGEAHVTGADSPDTGHLDNLTLAGALTGGWVNLLGGDDTLSFGPGGSASSMTLEGGAGNDHFHLNDGAHLDSMAFYGDDRPDPMSTASGSDSFEVHSGGHLTGSTLFGGDGADSFSFLAGSHLDSVTAFGGDGNDSFSFSPTANVDADHGLTLVGGLGDDTFALGPDNVYVYGGDIPVETMPVTTAGVDTLDASGASGPVKFAISGWNTGFGPVWSGSGELDVRAGSAYPAHFFAIHDLVGTGSDQDLLSVNQTGRGVTFHLDSDGSGSVRDQGTTKLEFSQIENFQGPSGEHNVLDLSGHSGIAGGAVLDLSQDRVSVNGGQTIGFSGLDQFLLGSTGFGFSEMSPGAGNVTLVGGTGHDTFTGSGSGTDVFYYGNAANIGSAGSDVLHTQNGQFYFDLSVFGGTRLSGGTLEADHFSTDGSFAASDSCPGFAYLADPSVSGTYDLFYYADVSNPGDHQLVAQVDQAGLNNADIHFVGMTTA